MGLPSGVVTFLMTDAAGFTEKLQSHPKETRAAVRRHNQLITGCVERHGGAVVKARFEGDSTFSAFQQAGDALRAAADVQLALLAEDWPKCCPMHVRASLYTGDAAPTQGDYIAPVVNRCARLLEVAHPSQVLLPAETLHAAGNALETDLSSRSLGMHRLRDLLEPALFHQLLHPDLPDEFPEQDWLDTRAHNLPIWITSFVGRERELSEVRVKLLSQSRQLTVKGAGGSGKTRLAAAVAARMLDDFPDHVWFVGLSTLADTDLVEQEVAHVLGVGEQVEVDFHDAIVEHLSEKRALLILDNCEHLEDRVGPIVDLVIRSCPHVHILATSRHPLRVPQESIYRLRQLSRPAPGTSDPRRLSQSDAVRLIVDRAQRTDEDFALTDDNGAAIAEICYLLDGLPLAIELVAPLIAEVPLPQILSELRAGREPPGSEQTPSDRRHATLDDAFGWSFERLQEDEKQLFAELSVFRGGFDLEAATHVTGRQTGDETACAALLVQLGRRSLVRLERLGDGIERYSLLETMRAYAQRRLAELARMSEAGAAHAEYFLALARRESPDREESLGVLQRERENLRAALVRAAERGDADYGLTLCTEIWWFWRVRSFFAEGRGYLEQFLAQPSRDSGPEVRMRALYAAGGLTYCQSDFEGAMVLFGEALDLARELGDKRTQGILLNNLGLLAMIRTDYETARRDFEASIQIDRDLGAVDKTAPTLYNLGLIAYALGDYDEAERYFGEGAAVATENDDDMTIASIDRDRAHLLLDRGELVQAKRVAKSGLRISLRLGDRESQVVAIQVFGAILQTMGRPECAHSIYAFSRDQAERIGSGWTTGAADCHLGDVALATGKPEEAVRAFRQSLDQRRQMGQVLGIIRSHCGLGMALHEIGSRAESRDHLETALALARDADDPRGEAEACCGLGVVLLENDCPSDARQLLSRALTIHRDRGHHIRVLWTLEHTAALSVAEERPEDALRLLSAALRGRRELGAPRSPQAERRCEATLKAASASVSKRQAASALETGARMPIGEAIDLALGQ